MEWRLLYTGWLEWRLSWFYHALPMNTGTTHSLTGRLHPVQTASQQSAVSSITQQQYPAKTAQGYGWN